MSWKLDYIDFSVYGVGVAKSSGVLNMPRIIDSSTDWLDHNGRDYWQDAGEVKYQAREIALSCWIRATGYEDFKTKVAAFYAALVAPGERTLTTPYWHDISHVTVQQSVQMVRKTQYVSSLQIGMFTLRLTVAGDSVTKLMTVYRQDDVIRQVVKYGNDAKLNRQLQGDSSISFQAEFNEIQTLGRGDYILFNNEKYIAFEYPQIDKISTNKCVYRLTYTNEFFCLKDIQFMVIDQPETAWYATAEEVVDLIIANANRAYPGLFIKGTVEATEYRNHQFNNESCFEVLSRIASEYEFEYEYSRVNPSDPIHISVKKQIGTTLALEFTYGKGNRAYKISRIPTPREKLCTKLFAFGSTKNLPTGYGSTRLKLSAPIERWFYDMQIERTKVYEDIFPERTGTVTGYIKREKQPTWVYAPGTELSAHPVKIYTFYPDENSWELTDTTMPFDLNELKDDGVSTKYLIAGTKAKIHFNSGDLAGLEFEILSYNHATWTFKIQPITEGGVSLPSDDLYPRLSDEYNITDINLPQPYIDAAVSRLYDAAYSSMYDGIDFNPPNADYRVETNPAEDFSSILPGCRLRVIDTDFDIDAHLRVVDINSNLYSNGSTITLSPNLVKSKRAALESAVASIERSIQAAKLDDVNQTRGAEQTTREVKDGIVDPIDEKLRVDERVRRRSIDPVMLSDDAGTPQFSIKDALVETNVDGDPNKIRISAGALLNHSFYAVDRKTIKIIKEL